MNSSETTLDDFTKDKGHRYGNFHSYYSFHPIQNRFHVLKETGILHYIQSRFSKQEQPKLLQIVDFSTSKSENLLEVQNDDELVTPKEKRIKFENIHHERQQQQQKLSLHKEIHHDTNLYYCDLGCNEGDLTLAMAHFLSNIVINSNNNCGQPQQEQFTKVKCLGLDIDSQLIERANDKNGKNYYHDSTNGSNGSSSSSYISSCFQTCNLCNANDFFKCCESFLNTNYETNCQVDCNTTAPITTTTTSGIICEKDNLPATNSSTSKSTTTLLKNKRFHLTSIFSTTMWIHIHAGDDGLKDFLKRACSISDMILIEPQPSKCYRNVNIRLRKLNRPEMDISPERLKLRLNIEKEVETIICSCGFRRILSGNEKDDADESNPDKHDKDVNATRTAWNRSLQLYVRC